MQSFICQSWSYWGIQAIYNISSRIPELLECSLRLCPWLTSMESHMGPQEQVLYNPLFSPWSSHVASLTCTPRPYGTPRIRVYVNVAPWPCTTLSYHLITLAFLWKAPSKLKSPGLQNNSSDVIINTALARAYSAEPVTSLAECTLTSQHKVPVKSQSRILDCDITVIHTIFYSENVCLLEQRKIFWCNMGP